RSGRAGARGRPAPRAAVGVAGGGVLQREPELLGERRQPGEHVAQLVEARLVVALADRLGQLAQLLGEPGDGRRRPAGPVPLAVDRGHPALELAQVHDPDNRTGRRPGVRVRRSPRSGAARRVGRVPSFCGRTPPRGGPMAVPSKTVECRVFDADNHYYEPVDMFERYIDPAYADRTFTTERRGDDTVVLFQGRPFGFVGGQGSKQRIRPGALRAMLRGEPVDDDEDVDDSYAGD